MEAQLLKHNHQNDKVKKITGDIISQAINGELVGMANFSALVSTIDDYDEKMEAAEHAESERKHAVGFIDLAKKHNIDPIINLQGVYWKDIHEKFLSYAESKDFIACLIIQEIMLESFAVSMYRETGAALGGEIGELLIKTSKEEEEHLQHSIEILRSELKRDGDKFIKKFHHIHNDFMSILSEWSSTKDVKGHCGVCNGNCMKEDLSEIGLSTQQLRAGALRTYAEALDEIGLPSEQTTIWILNLPV